MKVFRYPIDRVVNSYRRGSMGEFAHNRGNHRKHAGCDLYGDVGTRIYPVMVGVVVEPVSHHFLDSYGVPGVGAITVRHALGFICRYCEIRPLVKQGQHVTTETVIGEIMNIRRGKYHPPADMLHFELYSGSGKGSIGLKHPLTKANPYGRREDLMDPTFWLQFLEMFSGKS